MYDVHDVYNVYVINIYIRFYRRRAYDVYDVYNVYVDIHVYVSIGGGRMTFVT
jgi:hypothetical protein